MTDEKIPETNWLEEEAKNLQTNTNPTGEILPSLKLESGKITKFKVDFSNKFNSWTSPDGVVKAIIPVEHKGERKNLWLNKKNPLYHDIVSRGAKGQTEFAVSTTGNQKDTKYTIVEED
jgi:hypothetical protein